MARDARGRSVGILFLFLLCQQGKRWVRVVTEIVGWSRGINQVAGAETDEWEGFSNGEEGVDWIWG